MKPPPPIPEMMARRERISGSVLIVLGSIILALAADSLYRRDLIPALFFGFIGGLAVLLGVTAIRHARTVYLLYLQWWGHCPTCGYSLTGNTSGVCPECATDVRTHPPEDSG